MTNDYHLLNASLRKKNIKKNILIDKFNLNKTITSLQLMFFSFKFHKELYYLILIMISLKLINI